MEDRTTEENSTYLQLLKSVISPLSYKVIKTDYLALANGDQLSEEDPYFPAPKIRRRPYRVKFDCQRKNKN